MVPGMFERERRMAEMRRQAWLVEAARRPQDTISQARLELHRSTHDILLWLTGIGPALADRLWRREVRPEAASRVAAGVADARG